MPTQQRSRLKACLLSWFCGLEEKNAAAGENSAEKVVISTKESKWGKLFVEINLVVVVGFGFFMWGFFA